MGIISGIIKEKVVLILYRVGIMGDIILDILLTVDDFPVEDSEVILKEETFRLGGSAFNTAFELSSTELQPLLISTYGKDSAGVFIKEALKKSPIPNTFIFEEDTNTGKIYILLSPQGKRTMISSRSKMPIPKDFSVYKQFINNIDWLHVSGYLLSVKEQYERAIFAMSQAKKKGVLVSLDPGTNTVKNNSAEIMDALQYTDYFLPNLEEYHLLKEKTHFDKKTGYPTQIIKEGPDGASLLSPTKHLQIPTNKKLNSTNSIGAGDAFNAGFIFGMLTTNDLIKSCQKGNEFAYHRLFEQTR